MDYQPCYCCFGWYAKGEMWKHKCPLKPKAEDDGTQEKTKNRGVVKKGREMLPTVPSVRLNDATHRVLAGLRFDNIATLIKNDSLTVKLAKKLCFKLSHDEDLHSHIRTKLREVGRLVAEYRKITGEEGASLSTLIDPSKFMTVIRAVRSVAGFESQSKFYGTPSLALKLGHTLKKAAMIQLNEALMDPNGTARQKEVENFITLVSNKWEEEVSSHALRTLYQNKRNNPKLLPLTNDVVILSRYLQEKAEQHMEALETTQDFTGTWTALSRIAMVYLIVFNRRRQGEISKMTVDDYRALKKGESVMVEGQMEQMARWE